MNAAYEQRPELARQLKDLDHVADHTTHDIMRALNTSFITLFDREDIAVLAARMDDVVDHIEAAADLTPSDLAFFDPLWRDHERQQIFGDFLAGVRRGVESADRFDVPARARPADSCEVGGRVIRIADGDNASVDVGARASTASKIDFVRRPPRR